MFYIAIVLAALIYPILVIFYVGATICILLRDLRIEGLRGLLEGIRLNAEACITEGKCNGGRVHRLVDNCIYHLGRTFGNFGWAVGAGFLYFSFPFVAPFGFYKQFWEEEICGHYWPSY